MLGKGIHQIQILSLALIVMFAFNVQTSAQQKGTNKQSDLFEMSLEELMEVPITTGASRPMTKEKMPASITVITADELKLLGLRNLTDVINYIVPGGIADLHRGDKTGLYCFRGITADDNAKYIFMVDGLNSNSMTAKGAFTEAYLGLLDDLERIEITQGVSSTLYGDGATSGIINFITRTGKDFQGTEVTTGYGSGEKYEASIKYGRKISETQSDFYYFGFKRSDGFTPKGGSGNPSTQSRYWEEHAASGRHWDHFAPSGKFHSNIERGDFTLRTRYVREIFEEPYVWSQKTTGATTQYEERADRYIGHHYLFIQPEIKHRFNESHSIKANLSFEMDERWEEKIKDWYASAGGNQILKEGEEILSYGERKIRGQFFHYYDGLANHKLTSGAEIFWMLIGPDFYGDNKKISVSSGQKTRRASKEEERLYSIAAFFEDIWQINPQDTFFAGVRVENHNLTPVSISPHAAISHDFSEKTNLKFLYNSGYRIPAWTDYTQNESGMYPKPDPEKVQSFEAHLLHNFNHRFSTSLISYYTIYKDMLYYWSGHGKYNFPEVKAAGVELTGDYKSEGLKLRFSHSFSRPVHFSNNNYNITYLSSNLHDWAEFPTHMTKAQAIINLIKNKCMLGITYFRPWAIRGQQNADSKLKHAADYINATLTFNLNKNFELQLSGYNLTGEDRPWWGAWTSDGLSRDINPHTEYFIKLIWRF